MASLSSFRDSATGTQKWPHECPEAHVGAAPPDRALSISPVSPGEIMVISTYERGLLQLINSVSPTTSCNKEVASFKLTQPVLLTTPLYDYLFLLLRALEAPTDPLTRSVAPRKSLSSRALARTDELMHKAA